MSRSRSSQAEATRTAHQAAARKRWPAAEIQESPDNAPPGVPHDEAMVAMDAEIDAIENHRGKPARERRTAAADAVIAQAMLAATSEASPGPITADLAAALARLLAHARRDSGRSR